MKKTLLPTLCVTLVLLAAACGQTTTEHSNANAGNANRAAATNTTAPPATTAATSSSAPAATTAGTAGKIGIAECDDFLTKYEACVTGKVPEAARAQFNTMLEQWRKSWQQLAANPQTKGTLAQACKTSMEQARQSMTTYGCTF